MDIYTVILLLEKCWTDFKQTLYWRSLLVHAHIITPFIQDYICNVESLFKILPFKMKNVQRKRRVN
jgi:hypothetical protein